MILTNKEIQLISNEYRKNVAGIEPFIRATWGEFMMVETNPFRLVTNDAKYQLGVDDFQYCTVAEMQGGIKFSMDITDDLFVSLNILGEIEDSFGGLFEHWYFCHPLDMKRIDKKVIDILSKEYGGDKDKLEDLVDLYLNPVSDYPIATRGDIMSPLHIFH